jgi:corrinoid protein of di/trimethylamine methyltransferase
MPLRKDELLKGLSDSVVEMKEEETVNLANKVISEGYDAYEAIDKGLADGMERAGKLFEEEEYFIPELLICSDAMYAGLEILRPHVLVQELGEKQKVIIGVVEGDTHDIGKNLVKIMLETSGFEVIDLGRDVAPQIFVDKALENNAKIIALSTLMTTTMDSMTEVIRILDQKQLRNDYIILVGGGPVSQKFADKIGADGYAVNAEKAVRLAKKLLGGVA